MEKKLILDVHEKPKVAHWIALSIQHVLAMFGSTVLVPMLTGLPVSLALVSSGIGTLFYLFVTKGKSPVYLGSSFAYIAPITSALALGATLNADGSIASHPNYGAVMGGLMMVGLVYLVIALIIKFIGTDWLNKILPPVVIGPTIMVIGLSLAGTAVNMASEHIVVALITLLTAIIVSTYTKGLLQLLPIFSGIVVGYISAVAFQLVDFSAVNEASLFAMPNFAFLHSKPVFNLEVAAIMVPVAIVTITEHIGDHLVLGSIIGRDLVKKEPGLHRTLIGDGVATLLAGLIGGPANTTYGENTGVLELSRVYDPKVIRLAALYAILLSFIPKVSAVIGSMPSAIIGGVSFMLYGMISAIGVRNVVENHVDFTKSRNLIIAGVIFVCGLGFSNGLTFTIAGTPITLTALAIAAIAGIVLNAILPGNDYHFGKLAADEHRGVDMRPNLHEDTSYKNTEE